MCGYSCWVCNQQTLKGNLEAVAFCIIEGLGCLGSGCCLLLVYRDWYPTSKTLPYLGSTSHLLAWRFILTVVGEFCGRLNIASYQEWFDTVISTPNKLSLYNHNCSREDTTATVVCNKVISTDNDFGHSIGCVFTEDGCATYRNWVCMENLPISPKNGSLLHYIKMYAFLISLCKLDSWLSSTSKDSTIGINEAVCRPILGRYAGNVEDTTRRGM